MRSLQNLSILSLALLLAACQPATPATITVSTETEFTLVVNQAATLENTGINIQLTGISDDARCPSEIECAMSGPVSLSVSLQKDSEAPAEFALQTFTSNNGQAPEGPFEGIEDRVEYEGYLFRVMSVLPYPTRKLNEIREAEYQVSFLVTPR